MLRDAVGKTAVWLLRKSIGFDTTSVAWYARNGYQQLYSMLGFGSPSWTGESVSEATALNCSTVWACQRVISETVASLPLHLMQRQPSGKSQATDHPLYWVLHDEANEEMSDYTLRETMTAHAVIWGNAFAKKVRRGGTGQTMGLWPWMPDQVRIEKGTGPYAKKVFVVKEGSAPEKTYEREEVFHLPGIGFDGVRGYSVVQTAKQSIGIAQVQDKYVAKFFANGGRRPYYLRKLSPFKTDQHFDKFKAAWEKSYTASDGFHVAPIIEGDLELHELGMPLEDAQLLTSRQFSVAEICRWFRISPHLVGDLSRATFSNIEHLAIEFVQQTLMAWCIRWEKAINQQLLTEGEKGRYFAKHNFSALLRGDFPSRMAGYSTALQNGIFSINEVRDLEDMNPLPGSDGDRHLVQLNMQAVSGESLSSEAAAAAKLQAGEGGDNANRVSSPN